MTKSMKATFAVIRSPGPSWAQGKSMHEQADWANMPRSWINCSQMALCSWVGHWIINKELGACKGLII